MKQSSFGRMKRPGILCLAMLGVGLGAVLGSLVLAGCTGDQQPLDPVGPAIGPAALARPQPPPNPVIAYIVKGNRDKLNVMNADGSNQVTLFTSNSILYSPSWSPDGTAIAFYNNGDLWRINVDGTNARQLLSRTDPLGSFWLCAWSPLGNEIAVIGLGGDSSPRVLVVPASGGIPEVVYAPTPGGLSLFDVSWSSDGNRLAVVEKRADPVPDHIQIIDRATGAVVQTLLDDSGLALVQVDWARGGSNTLAFAAESAAQPVRSVYTVDLASGIPTLLRDGSWPSWSPDNTKLAYVPSGASRWVHVLDLATGQTQRLASGVDPDWRR